MSVQIREIRADETWPLRTKILWPNHPENAKVKEDHLGKHFGLFLDERLVSIVSLFENEGNFQFRKLATDHDMQGKGYATQLLNHIFTYTQVNDAYRIWCNAREDKSSFYERFGMKETDQTFIKSGIKYVIMERLF